ncbi:MAG: helix-turn-helix transcriptional regulator [Lachnospiraceae bacterium]
MIKYKIDVLEELKKKGYTATIIRKKKIMAESTLTRLREGKTSISCDSIGVICSMLRCQPSDIIENTITNEEKIKLFID